MRFLVFMIPEAYQPTHGQKTGPDFMPDAGMLAKIGRFNEELRKFEGRIKNAEFVADGPAVEAREVVGGYWMLQADSKQEVVELMKRCPAQEVTRSRFGRSLRFRIFPRRFRRRSRDQQ